MTRLHGGVRAGWLLAVAFALAAPPAHARDAILHLGNSLSYWYDVPAQLQRMLGDDVRVVAALRGGAHVVDYVDDGIGLGGTRCSLAPFEARQMRVTGFTVEAGSVLEPVAGSEPVLARTRAIDDAW